MKTRKYKCNPSSFLSSIMRNPDGKKAAEKLGFAVAELYNHLRLEADLGKVQSSKIIEEITNIAIIDEEDQVKGIAYEIAGRKE
jgi:hypothetical protein